MRVCERNGHTVGKVYRFLGEQLVEFGTVEADHDIGVIDDDNRYSHLVRFFNHLTGGVPVFDDVMVGINNVLF